MDYKKLAYEILPLIGGKENVSKLTHCATRLRFELYDYDKVNIDSLNNLPGIISIVNKGGQFQIVIGNNVTTTYQVLINEINTFSTKKNDTTTNKKNIKYIVNEILSTISTTFTPVIPALIGGGMIKAILSIFVLFGLNQDSHTYQIINFISDTAFYFMPVLLAYGASIKFECSPILSITLACTLLHPTWTKLLTLNSSNIDFFSIPVKLVDYSYSVIPIILSIWILSYVEQFAEKYTPSIIKFFFKPLIVLFISAPIALIIIGPFGYFLNSLIELIANTINSYASWLLPMLMGAFQPLLTLTGTAWAITPIATVQISSLGYEIVNGPGMLASNIAQGAATLAVAFMSKNTKLRQLSYSSGFTAVMGITEPALYGVLIKLKKPLIASMIGGGIGGIYAGLSGLVRYAFVSPGLAALPAFIGENPMNIIHALVTCLISFFSTFIITWILGFDNDEDNKTIQKEEQNKIYSKKNDENLLYIASPISGKTLPLTEVPDDVFSSKVMGNGLAIKPSEGNVYAPFDGQVVSLFDTLHAIGLISTTGIELLIHIGIDTVNLNGKYYKSYVKIGDKISAGDLLLSFEQQKIEEAGFSTITPIIVTNSNNYSNFILQENMSISHGNNIIKIS